MKLILFSVFINFLLNCSASICAAQAPSVNPQLFAPGIISTEFQETSASFTPNGKTVYFTRSDIAFADNTIMVSHFRNNSWSKPEVASFSGMWRDSEPHVSPDGTKLFFVSNRPVAAGSQPLLTPRGTPGANIWYVNKTSGSGWSEPIHIDGPVNAGSMVYNPSVTKNGTLYFSGVFPDGGGRNQIYRSVPTGGVYGTPERLSFSDPKWNTMDPSISPDERYMVFASNRAGGFDLHICFQKDGEWSEPVKLGDGINTSFGANAPSLAPDGRTLYFTSIRRRTTTTPFPKIKEKSSDVEKRLRSAENGSRNIWFVNIGRWIDDLGKN